MTDFKYINSYLVLALIAVVFFGGFYLGYNLKQCPEIVRTELRVKDSIVDVKREPIVIGGQPKLVQTRKYKEFKDRSSSAKKPKNEKLFTHPHNDTNDFIENSGGDQSFCLDTNIYFKETHEPDSFRIMTYAEVTGNEMIKLKVTYENLKPEIIRIIERTNTIEKKQSLVKVYLGAYANVAIQSKAVASYRGGLALDAIISDKHMIGLQGGVNSFLQPEIGIRFSEKIRLKK